MIILYQNSPEVFTLFAVLNVMGYDNENRGRGMSPIRRRIRKLLLKQNWGKRYPTLKRGITTLSPWHLLNAILAKPKKRNHILDRFASDLKRFFQEPLVQEAWKIFEASQARENKRLSRLFKAEALRLLSFLNRPPENAKKIVLIANLLDAYWSGYALNVAGTGYVVAGPGAEKNHGELLRHELLHILAPDIKFPPWILNHWKSQQLTRMGYGSRSILNREYVVRGLNILYESEVLERNLSKSLEREQRDFKKIKEAVRILRDQRRIIDAHELPK